MDVRKKYSKIFISLNILILIAVVLSACLFMGWETKYYKIILGTLIVALPMIAFYHGYKSLKRLILINLFVSLCLSFSTLFFQWSLSIAMLVVFPLFVYAVGILFLNIISLFVYWVEYDSAAFTPLLISVLTIPAVIFAAKGGVYVDIYLDDYFFKKEFSRYEEAIKILEKYEKWPLYLHDNSLPEPCRQVASMVHGEKENENFTIILMQGREGFAYFSGNDANCPKSLKNHRIIKEHWYKIN